MGPEPGHWVSPAGTSPGWSTAVVTAVRGEGVGDGVATGVAVL